MNDMTISQEILSYLTHMGALEFFGLVFGLLCVYFLVKENILTWICGIIYILISFVVFWNARLYGDFLLHVIFLILNIYGWIHWVKGGSKDTSDVLPITHSTLKESILLTFLSIAGIMIFQQGLLRGPGLIENMPPADLPFWDSTTSVLSITGMWLTARKKLDNWYYWLMVDILATGIYYYKGMYFYSLLYFIYIGLALTGLLAWKKKMNALP